MDLISQIQNYILSLSKLLNRAFERILEVPPLNPDDALICSTMDDKSQEGRQTDVDHDGGVSQPYYQTSTDTKHGKNEKEKVTEWERNKLESPLYASTGIGLIEEGKEIFNRVGTGTCVLLLLFLCPFYPTLLPFSFSGSISVSVTPWVGVVVRRHWLFR